MIFSNWEAERLQLVAAHHAEQGRKLLAEAPSGRVHVGGDVDLMILLRSSNVASWEMPESVYCAPLWVLSHC